MDRVSLKGYAKEFLKKHFLEAWGIMFVMRFFLAGGETESWVTISRRGVNWVRETGFDFRIGPGGFNWIREFDFDFGVPDVVTSLILSPLMIIVAIAAFLFGIFVTNNLRIGVKNYFIHALSDAGANVDHILMPFKQGYWKQLGLKLFYVDLIIFLWSLLLIIPGVIKSYQYRWVPYLLAENPEWSADEAMRKSTAMTEGEKTDLFVLDLSFIGWYLLSGLIFPFLSVPLVDAYVQSTFGTYYLLKREIPFYSDEDFFPKSPL